MKQHWPAAERNKEPILEILRGVLTRPSLVLEIASGTGQHAVHFAANLPHLTWQPTDLDPANRASTEAWRLELGTENLLPPLELDALAWPWPVDRADAIWNANLIHIAPWEVTPALFRGASQLLPTGAPLLMYGPYLRGADSAPSNLAFSQSLQSRDPSWGVRELDAVVAEAGAAGFGVERIVPMPANNLTVVYRKR